MCESSGGTALREKVTSDHQIEVRLVFQSHEYTLPELAQRIQDVEALMDLLLKSQSVLNPPKPLSSGQLAKLTELINRKTSSRSRSFLTNRAARPNFLFLPNLQSMRPNFRYRPSSQSIQVTRFKAIGNRGARVRVETVKLSSPLEILLIVSGSLTLLGTVAKLMPKFIQIKNDWNESRVTRAKSNVDIERLRLEKAVVKLMADEVEKLDMDTYFDLPDNHPSKKVVKSAVRALSSLDKAEVRE